VTRSISSRARLGGGIVELPTQPEYDPATAVITEPSVAEEKRFCSACDEPVGRRRGDAAARAIGFCRKCGHPFDFTPKLAPGDLVGGQYAVVGCLAHGGLGWIYLAQDQRLEQRWVVLKGLLNASDPDARTAAIAERRFLAEVKHPNIVQIINFVEHGDDGYIVMEYVAGTSLRQLLDARGADSGDRFEPLPAAHAMAYILEILPALGYLHEHGLLFCDFKPDNVIQTADSLKLIDLGGVYRMADDSSPIYGTPGYQAPEIAQTGPTIATDVYTVGRTLAVLCTGARGLSTRDAALPAPETVPLFAANDSLYRLLARATALAPDARFQDAEEMADQLRGVLREFVAREQERPVAGASNVFSPELRSALAAPDWSALPTPLVRADDPAAVLLATLAVADTTELLEALEQAPDSSIEVAFRRTRAMLELGDVEAANHALEPFDSNDASDWRFAWFRGLTALAARDATSARDQFRAVYFTLPGELAPKLALAFAAEVTGDEAVAECWYDIVSRTDAAYTSAVFGLARTRLRRGNRAGAVVALDRIPPTSNAYVEAQIARAQALVPEESEDPPALKDVVVAARIVESQPIDTRRRRRLQTQLLRAALAALGAGHERVDGAVVFGRPLTEHDVRLGLEEAYRDLARGETDTTARNNLVDRANRVRPRTLT
jgi:serine/threonine-protein kinase PknG